MHLRALPLLALLLLSGIVSAAGPYAFDTKSWIRVFRPEGGPTTGGWIMDGIAFHAYHTFPGTNKPGVVRLYAMDDASTHDNLYTTDRSERDAIHHRRPHCTLSAEKCSGLRSDYVPWMFVYDGPGPGRVPLYRFYNGRFHFFSTDMREGLDAGYKYEHVTAYVLLEPAEGTRPVYRYHWEE